ncbi:FAD-binding oxidoreductase [Bosea sp. 685]|uniref:FAD-binding oxidoreductase n=1 Tax=Bosea sp. 685 TaxID=3080057 RepID=UPI002892FDE4|nr:FAD-binding oxidoreductase [Bosea sp. 685]WNJ88008.1 FAD-binding oxidoreductase [Bosea sp. 685]
MKSDGPTIGLEDMASRLRDAIGPTFVRVGGQVPERNGADASRLPPIAPSILATPDTTEAVSQVLRLCSEAHWPVVVQGGLTGLAGGAHPKGTEVALSLERMTGIEEIDPVAGTLTARAGTILQVVQQAAVEAGFLCGIDLGARGSCTIGGNVATNAGGNRVLRYGMTRHNVLGLEAVLADGTIVTSLNKMLKNNAGYDWTQMFIGSEGTLGVVTRVVLGLHPLPGDISAAFLKVSDFAAAVAVQRALERALPGRLMAFEAMWPEVMAMSERCFGLKSPFASHDGIALLVEVEASESEVDALEGCLMGLVDQGVVQDAFLARSEADRLGFWKFRETPYEYRSKFGTMVSFDISLPRALLEEAVGTIRNRVLDMWPDTVVAVFGHLADSNLHVILLRVDETLGGYEAVESVVYGTVGEFGGSISAEHGIGRKKRAFLHLSRSPAEIALMERVKAALDPGRILNRDRVLGGREVHSSGP